MLSFHLVNECWKTETEENPSRKSAHDFDCDCDFVGWKNKKIKKAII